MKIWEDDCKYLTFTLGNFIQVKIFKSNFIGHCFAYLSDAHRGDEFFSGTPEQVIGKLEPILGILNADIGGDINLETKIKNFLQDEIEKSKTREAEETGG
jgi:hypothetical protein